ncbi:HET-domain-containing protein, partial [Hyaloscypha variabilis F]
RLISLLPGEGTSPIVCQMLTVDLNTKPRYEALSYVWGVVDDSNKCGILVNGAPFPVGENLWLALYHLRDKTGVQPLWIDAICINQKDELEKATQIREMKNIYSKASTVLAWLGTSNEYLDEAFDTMEALYCIIPRSILYGPPIVFPLTEDAARDLIAMCRIFSVCPYWSRVWIIQEVLLAKDLVICC